jgi:hypothetical protein
MLHFVKTIENQDFEMLRKRNYCKQGIDWMVEVNNLAMDCSLRLDTFQDLRFGIKFIFSSKIEIIDGGEGLNSSHSSYSSFMCLFHLQL